MQATDAFRANVQRLLEAKRLTASALTSAVGKRSTGWASMFLTGKRDVPVKVADQIAAFLGVELWELLLPDGKLPENHLHSRVVHFDPEEQRLLDAFRELGDEGRTAALVTLDSLAQHFPKTRQRRRRPAPPPKVAADDDL